MRKLTASLMVLGTLLLTGCDLVQTPTEADRHKVLNELKEQCHLNGGKYVLTRPEGYVSAGYFCIWDEK